MDGRKILIVDDDADIRLGLTARLRASGFDTVFAEDGDSAVAAASSESPAAILLDLGLPRGDGFEVLRRLKDETALASIPVIILSARDPYENEKRSLEGGAHAFFQKPADNEALIAAIGSAID